MVQKNSVIESRNQYKPTLSEVLDKIAQYPRNSYFEEADRTSTKEDVRALLPHISHDAVLRLKATDDPYIEHVPLRVGVILSGGQAPGGHSVISALYWLLIKIHPSSHLIGIENGPDGLLKKTSRILTEFEIRQSTHVGGFHLLGTSRKKIETDDELLKAEEYVRELQLDGLVIIGGDDSNTNAAILAERFQVNGVGCSVVGVPKTIDGDLQNHFLPISFGFDTACRTYSELIGNIGMDILSAKKYYFFIRLMGRSASHITLECALQTKPNCALISEEIEAKNINLSQVVEEIVQLVVDRYNESKNYGLILLPEGLIEVLSDIKILIAELNDLFSPRNPLSTQFIALKTPDERLLFAKNHLSDKARLCLVQFPEEIEHQLVFERDSHGNVPVSQIETERLLLTLVQKQIRLRYNHIPFMPLSAFYGYEGRSAYPTNFDVTLCTNLGYIAGLLIAHKKNGYMAAVTNMTQNSEEWIPLAIPISSLMQLEERKGISKPVIEKAKVDLQGIAFATFARMRSSNCKEDNYISPGPIQFYGSSEGSVELPVVLSLRYNQ